MKKNNKTNCSNKKFGSARITLKILRTHYQNNVTPQLKQNVNDIFFMHNPYALPTNYQKPSIEQYQSHNVQAFSEEIRSRLKKTINYLEQENRSKFFTTPKIPVDSTQAVKILQKHYVTSTQTY